LRTPTLSRPQCVDDGIVQAIAVHRGKQRDHPKLAVFQQRREARADVPGGWIEHEEPDEAGRMPHHGRPHGRFIARNARDQCRPGDTVAIELRDPPVSQLLRRSRRIPAKRRRNGGGSIAGPEIHPLRQ
jgi:hypothetical protein